jgi:hypothetical protein
MSVASITDTELLRRAVTQCRDRLSRKGEKHPRWLAVNDTFLLGSTYSRELCRRFGLDPDEMVTR